MVEEVKRIVAICVICYTNLGVALDPKAHYPMVKDIIFLLIYR